MSSDHLKEPEETPGPAQPPLHRRRTDGWQWKLIWTIIGGVLVVLLALIALGLYGIGQKGKASATEQTLGELASQVQVACTDNPVEARKVFGDVCGKAKEIDERPPEKKADPVAKGMTEAEVRSVVESEIGKTDLTVTPAQVNQIARTAAGLVPKPKDGKSPTSAQVQGVVSATVLTFCAQDSRPCEGDEGPKGKDAPPITEARLRDAVAAFCGEGAVNCRGGDGSDGAAGSAGRGIKSITKTGETVTVTYTDDTSVAFIVPNGVDGTNGVNGEQGRSIVDTDCLEDGRWRITYDKPFPDGDAVRYARGPCRVVAAPEPTPEAKGR